MEGAERYPPRSNAVLAGCFAMTPSAYNDKLKHQSLPILEQMLETLQTIRDRRLLWSEDIVSLNKKISELSSQNQTLAFLKQNGLVDPDIFISKSNELTRQLRQVKLDKEKLMAAEGDATAHRTRELIALLEDGPDFLDRPDAELMGELVEKITIKELRATILAENKEHAEADRRIRDAAGMLENAVPHIAEWDESAVRQLVAQVKVLSKNEISVTLKSGIEIRQSISN